MADPFLAEIRIFPFNFPPRGWAFCDGQILPLSQNTALFSLLGTTYGGDGQRTFALPDLRGRLAIGFGQGPGLSNYALGQVRGEEFHTLVANEVPPHAHTVNALNNGTSGGANTPSASALLASAYLAEAGNPAENLYSTSAPSTAMGIVSSTGGQAHDNRMPYLPINYCIALTGIFPSRN